MNTLPRELELLDEFHRVCRERIIAGNAKYGRDWRWKNNLGEAQQELFDLANYAFLHWLQTQHLAELDDAPARIYIAGPYSTGNTEHNIRCAGRVGRECLKRGWVPFIPHTMTAGWERYDGLDYEDFMRVGLAWLRRCNALVLFGDWTASPGALRERRAALEWGITVYETLADVPDLTALQAVVQDKSHEL